MLSVLREASTGTELEHTNALPMMEVKDTLMLTRGSGSKRYYIKRREIEYVMVTQRTVMHYWLEPLKGERA